MEVDEATIVTASTKRGASEDPQDAAKRLRTDDADAMDEAAARTRAEMTPAEREEAGCIEPRLGPKRSRAAQAAAKERGVALSAAEVAALKKEQEAKPKFVSEERNVERLALERLAKKTRAQSETQERSSSPHPCRGKSPP